MPASLRWDFCLKRVERLLASVSMTVQRDVGHNANSWPGNAVLDGIKKWLVDSKAIPLRQVWWARPAPVNQPSLGLIVTREICRGQDQRVHPPWIGSGWHRLTSVGREAEGKLVMASASPSSSQTTSRLLCLEESFGPRGEQIFIQKSAAELQGFGQLVFHHRRVQPDERVPNQLPGERDHRSEPQAFSLRGIWPSGEGVGCGR